MDQALFEVPAPQLPLGPHAAFEHKIFGRFCPDLLWIHRRFIAGSSPRAFVVAGLLNNDMGAEDGMEQTAIMLPEATAPPTGDPHRPLMIRTRYRPTR